MNEEWPKFHLPWERGLWVMPHGLKGRGRGLAITGILPFILLSRAFDYLI